MYYNNKKLYTDSTVSIDTTSTLQYDFNLNAGDTFNLSVSDPICYGKTGYYKIPVDSVDSMYYGNKWRKRIVFKQVFFSGVGLGGPITWVEGIGDIDHGLGIGNNVYGFIEFCYCTSGFAQLNCFQEPGYATYGSDCVTGTCGTSINEINNISSIFIYPNPASAKIYIERTNNDVIDLSLFDMVGKQVSQAIKSKSQTTEVDVSGLREGVYFMRVKTEKGNLIKKIVIHH